MNMQLNELNNHKWAYNFYWFLLIENKSLILNTKRVQGTRIGAHFKVSGPGLSMMLVWIAKLSYGNSLIRYKQLSDLKLVHYKIAVQLES